jgi:esterase/lipase superfamily enzyme
MVNILYDVTNDLQDCISNVCIIAHSMGNYVFREALTSLVGSSRSPAGTFIDQFIMIGADVGNTSLEHNGKGFGITRFSNRVSVYFSPDDSTLSKSKRKNSRPRLGRTLSSGYIQTPDNVVFCDCREWANESQLGKLYKKPPSVHSCYRSVDAILKDMFYTLIGIDREMIPERKMLIMNKLYRLVAKSED